MTSESSLKKVFHAQGEYKVYYSIFFGRKYNLIIVARKKKPPSTPVEFEQEIVNLIASWGDTIDIIHGGCKKHHHAINKKNWGCSPLTIEDHFILGNLSLKVKYNHYYIYNTQKKNLSKAKKNSTSTPTVLRNLSSSSTPSSVSPSFSETSIPSSASS